MSDLHEIYFVSEARNIRLTLHYVNPSMTANDNNLQLNSAKIMVNDFY